MSNSLGARFDLKEIDHDRPDRLLTIGTAMRILVVEDEPAFGAALQRALETQGGEVLRVPDAESAYRAVHRHEFDLAVVDWMLPGQDGPWLIQRLRERSIGMPVIMLTARDAVEDRVAGLDAGADDYLVKPFQLAELMARIRALLRRPAPRTGPILELGALALDTEQRAAELSGRRLDLTAGECVILKALLRHRPGAATRDALAEALASVDGAGTAGSIETHMSRLRAKLGAGPVSIRTLRGLGYRLEERTDGRA